MQSFSVPSKTSEISEDAVKSNLTQDNSNSVQDLTKVTDPSKIDASHFADGTHWTPAGWTRLGKDTAVAKSSKFDIQYVSKDRVDSKTGIYKEQQGDPVWVHANKITFTVGKDDLAKGGRVLAGTIQLVPTQDKQNSVADMHPSYAPDLFGNGVTSSTYPIGDVNGKQVGWLSADQSVDSGEIEIWFNMLKPIKDTVSDATFTYTFQQRNFVVDIDNNGDGDYSGYYSAKNNWEYPLRNSVVTNSSILNYQTNFDPNKVKNIEDQNYSSNGWSIIPGNTWMRVYRDNYNYPHQVKPDLANPNDDIFVYKINTIKGQAPTGFHFYINNLINIYDANGHMTEEKQRTDTDSTALSQDAIKKADNMSSLDLLNATPDGQATYSWQSDGSYLLCAKIHPKAITREGITRAVNQSYLANIQDPKHYDQILANTLKNTKSWSYAQYSFNIGVPITDEVINVSDATPNSIRTSHFNSFNISASATDGTIGKGSLETWKMTKISYVDDDDNGNVVASDPAFIGQQNKAKDYQVNVPTGFYLGDNSNSTNYVWSADKTKITYTFDKDQAENDANPIVIHLRHIISAVTDPNYINSQSRCTFTITYPDKHVEVITQVIGLKRTGTYDEAVATIKGKDTAEKEGKYTPWTLNDASKSYVTSTVNGQTTHTDKYIALDLTSTSTAPRFAAITLPRIAGYTAEIKQNKINPAMFMVSFVAIPISNTNHRNITTPDDSKSNHNITAPDNTTKHDTVSSTSRVIELNDKNFSAPDWQIKGVKTHDYLVSKGGHEYELPIVNGKALNLIKTSDASLAFNYIKLNTPSDYVFILRRHRKMYQLDIKEQNGTRWQTVKTLRSRNYKSLMRALSKLI